MGRLWAVGAVVCGVAGALGLAGCAGMSGGTAGVKLTGKVNGGQQPIAGSHVYLFAANTTGYGGNGIAASPSNASVSLLTNNLNTHITTVGDPLAGDFYVTTGSDGSFTITGDYTCTAGQQVYLYALGGDPGAGTNSAAGLMAALGACPTAGNFAAATPYVVVNEVSTVATAYALAGFATDATHVSSSGTALAQTAIANAFANAANLETLSTGTALATTPAGDGTVPQSEINTLANILAACVNTTGPTSTGCMTLFANATADGTSTGAQPTDTATAAINIAHYLGTNVANLFGLSTGTPPFEPGLTSPPSDWKVTLSYTGTTHVSEISTPVNHIVWDAAHGVFWATLPGTGANPNSVVAIDPVTGSLGTPVAAGSGPDVMALASDGSFLYVAEDGSSAVARFTLPALTLDPTFNISFPDDPTYAPQTAIAMAVAPGSPHTLAAIIGSYKWGPPNTGGTVLYDDAVARPLRFNDTAEFGGANPVWGANSSVLYETDTSSDGTLWVNTVSPAGIALANAYGEAMESQNGVLQFDPTSGFVYSDNGNVVNPANGNLVGTFNVSSLYPGPRTCVPDVANNRVFFLGQLANGSRFVTPPVTILAFDATTYQLVGTLTVSGAVGYPADFTRWGNAGLAFTLRPQGGTGQPNSVYLVDGSFISSTATPDFTSGTIVTPLPAVASISPQAVSAGSGAVSLTITGTNFQSSSSVLWNGTPLITNVLSASALEATVPSTDLAAASTALVTVSNGPDGSSNGSLAFTITPASPGTTNLLAVNLASLDLAWDSAGDQLIAPVWSADPQFPNSIVAIDPATGLVTKAAPVAADPTMARITSDGSRVYTGFKAANEVTQLALPSLTASTSFSLGIDPYLGPWYAMDLQPAPGAPLTTAVILGTNGEFPNQGSLEIYQNGVLQPNIVAGGTVFQGKSFNNLQWGGSASTLYAGTDQWTSTFYTMAVNSFGVTLTSSNSQALGSAGSTLHFDAVTGYIYDNNGQVIDPATGAQIGAFGSSGLVAVDGTLGRVFILHQTTGQSGGNYTIQSFNQTTFAPVSSIPVTSVVGTPVAFIRWGANGLAFVTQNTNASATSGPAGMLYIISDTGFVR